MDNKFENEYSPRKDFIASPSPIPLTKKQINVLSNAQIHAQFSSYDKAIHDKKAEICKLREQVEELLNAVKAGTKHLKESNDRLDEALEGRQSSWADTFIKDT